MGRDRIVPDVASIIASHEARIGKLERRLTQIIDSRRLPAVFSWDANPLSDAVGVELGKWRPVHPCEVVLSVPELVSAGGSDLTIDLNLYGPGSALLAGAFRTLTIPAGQLYVEDAVPFIIPAGGSLTPILTADGGALGLTLGFVPLFL